MVSPIFKEYCSYIAKQKEKYGDKSVVLMQVGSFYEIYAILNEDEELGEVNIYHICNDLLNISVAPKTNKVLMGGFQLPYSEKFIKLLIDNDYTVTLVQQVSEPPNVVREITEVISPGTYTNADTNKNMNNYMMSIYIESLSNEYTGVGVAIIDVCTGKNYIHQIDGNSDRNFWKDELNRLINYYSPREFLFQTENMDLTHHDIMNYWDIQNSSLQINHYKDKSLTKINNQNKILQKIFNFKTAITPLEELGIHQKYELTQAYVYMLEYVNEHKTDCLRNLERPELLDNIHHLMLTSTSVRQLNVVNNYSYYKGQNESLYSICSGCGFIGGRRLLKERLLYPSINKDVLNLRYDRVEQLMDSGVYTDLRKDLRYLTDLDKSLRKMGTDAMEAPSFISTISSYTYLKRVIDYLSVNNLMKHYSQFTEDIITFNSFYKEIQDTFQIQHLSDSKEPYFKKGYHQDMDDLHESMNESYHKLNLIQQRLSNILETKDACKLGTNDKHGIFLYCTKKRSTILKQRFNNIPEHLLNIRDNSDIIFKIQIESFNFKTKDSSSVFVSCDKIKELTCGLESSVEKMKQLNKTYWNPTMTDLYFRYKDCLQRIHLFISDVDLSSTIAKLSLENKYCRPSFRENEKSCLVAKDIRHPLVEKISTETEYVTNDVSLGLDEHDGMLLFGTNACGKSTLMKAVGLNVIMAQSGFFVPCSSFEYKPYTKIFTRILNNDNIFRSQSSFAVEMLELKTIFQSCDSNSLILGDELCSGTETLSAISIVSQSICCLAQKKTSFIITSHLHQLTELKQITELSNVQIYHLKITNEDGVLVYDRRLCSGAGPNIYGLIVCEAMGLPTEFVTEANKTLKLLKQESSSIITTKQSQYNSDILMDECKVCKGEAQETHHIKEQCTADDNNMIDHHHKNTKHNLVPLCKQCHLQVTHGGLEIYGWKQTSRGKVLDYEFKSRDKKKVSKYTDEQIQIMLSYKDKVKEGLINKTTCINMIDTTHNFRPSSKYLNELFA